MKKAASALLLAGAISIAGAGAATAYVPTPPENSVSAQSVAPGGTVTIQFSGFTPNESVRLTLIGESGAEPIAMGGAGINGLAAGVNGLIILNQPILETTEAAGPDGVFIRDVQLPTEPGTYTLTAVGLTSGHTVSATVVVDAALGGNAGDQAGNNTAAGAGLANTGADSTMLLWGAAGALALGAGVVSIAVAQRKKTA